MTLREEIQPYIDGNGLVAPHLTGPIKGSDNGVMFTSEYYVMLQKLGQLVSQDLSDFQAKIGQCITPEGMLSRVPMGQIDGQEGPDDYVGVLNGCKQLGNTKIPRTLLWATVKYLGFLNNDSPGTKDAKSFLIRQPQLVAAMVAAAFPSLWNPLHFACRLLALPFFTAAAISIFVSCINAPPSDSDARRLSWHLLQTVVPVSIMCKLASLFWWHRVYSVYGSFGMKGVAARYYESGHPFIKWWQD